MKSVHGKLGFVAPWYGEHIPGGAEAASRALVGALSAAGLEVEVLTTCVREFRSDWNVDHHPAGLAVEGAVPVRRFPVRRRDVAAFDRVNAKLMAGSSVSADEERTFVTEMINSPKLYEYLSLHAAEYTLFFIPYMFGTTCSGVQVCPERSVLIPCLHDESYARMEVFRPMFRQARMIVCLSRAERELALRLYGLDPGRTRVIGVPLDCQWQCDPQRFVSKYGLADFLLYAGRTDEGKNSGLLIDFFLRYARETGSRRKLVFIGGGEVDLPRSSVDSVIRLGFLSEQDKRDCYAAALALCVPSTRESFSIVMMESWLAGRPVIVNQDCAVTTDYCQQSNGGLYFGSYEEFREILNTLSADPMLATALGRQGGRFVRAHYTRDRIVKSYLGLLADLYRV